MQIIQTNQEAFKKLLVCFDKRPKIIPGSSIIVCDSKKPLSLICLYSDAGVIFIHGIFKSRLCSKKEFLQSIKFAQKVLSRFLKQNFSIVSVSKIKTIQKIFEQEGFLREETDLLFWECKQ